MPEAKINNQKILKRAMVIVALVIAAGALVTGYRLWREEEALPPEIFVEEKCVCEVGFEVKSPGLIITCDTSQSQSQQRQITWNWPDRSGTGIALLEIETLSYKNGKYYTTVSHVNRNPDVTTFTQKHCGDECEGWGYRLRLSGLDANGTRLWRIIGEMCENPCYQSNYCPTNNARRCFGGRPQKCVNHLWANQTACTSWQSCSNGLCVKKSNYCPTNEI